MSEQSNDTNTSSNSGGGASRRILITGAPVGWDYAEGLVDAVLDGAFLAGEES